jgi:hypothetical protein
MDTDAGHPEKSRPDNCEHRALFDPPPLFEGEEKSYDQLLIEVSRAVMPTDFLEEKICGCGTSFTSRSRRYGYAGSKGT